MARRAAELDPLSPIIHVALGYAYLQAGRYDESTRQLRAALEVDSSFANAHQFLGLALQRTGRLEEGLAEMLEADRLRGNWIWKASLAALYVTLSRRSEADSIVREFERLRPRVTLATEASLYAAVGERDRSLALLERACDQRDPDLAMMVVSPLFEPLARDPVFVRLLGRIGLS